MAPGVRRGVRAGAPGLRELALRKLGYFAPVEHFIVDDDLVDVAATLHVVHALHLVGTDDAGMGSELVEAGIEGDGGIAPGGLAAVDVEADPAGLIPAEGEVGPFLLCRQGIDGGAYAYARKIIIGDEGVEAVAVVVDAHPGHVPAAVVGEGDAPDGELRGGEGQFAAAPEEGEGALAGVDVARSAPGQQLAVAAAQGLALHAVVDG